MINNPNIRIARGQISTRNTQRTIGQQHALSSSQPLSLAPIFSSNSPSLQSIIQVIQGLIKQLQQGIGKKRQPQLHSRPTIPANIEGTSEDDQLKGTRNGDRIIGFAGNDRLYGGRGDDTLHGGTGNDYLSGGRGKNRLLGGDGNDTLYSRLGSDFLDGGRGNDIARIRAGIDDFSISVNDMDGTTEVLVLTHKETNQTIEVTNIETFKFNDVRLGLDELKQRAFINDVPSPTSNDQLLDLSAKQTDNLFRLFGSRPSEDTGIRAIDKDGNNKISIGDVAVLAKGDASSISQQFRTLSAKDVEKINGTPSLNTAPVSGGGVSVGGTTGGSIIPDDRIVTIKGQNYSVGFLKEQVDNYAESSYPPTGFVDTGFGIFKWGTSNSFAAGNAFQNYIADTFPQGEPNQPPANSSQLNLTDKQQEAIGARFNRKPPPNLFDGITTHYTGIAIDNDGDSKLGVGDSVQLRVTGGIAGLDETQERVLTIEDIAAIDEDRSNPLLDISNGLSMKQKQRLHRAIFGERFSFNSPSIQSVFDHNSDKKLSVGDTVLINTFSELDGASSVSFHTLTQNELDTYLQGSADNQQAQIDLETNKRKWMDMRPEDYSFTLDRSGFLFGDVTKPVDLTVNDNKITRAQFADGSNGQVPELNKLTVDSLFGTIGQALDSDAAVVRVTYNKTTGVPESIFIDQSQLIADEEVFLSTRNFQRL